MHVFNVPAKALVSVSSFTGGNCPTSSKIGQNRAVESLLPLKIFVYSQIDPRVLCVLYECESTKIKQSNKPAKEEILLLIPF